MDRSKKTADIGEGVVKKLVDMQMSFVDGPPNGH